MTQLLSMKVALIDMVDSIN